MTTEEKASSYAWSKEVKDGKIEVWHFRDEVHEMLVEAYLAGAAEALRSQWRDAEAEHPKGMYPVYGHFKDENGIDCYVVAYYDEEDGVWNREIDLWMELPPLPDTEEQ